MSKALNLIKKLNKFVLDNYCDGDDCETCSMGNSCPVPEAKEYLDDNEYGEDDYE